MLHRQDIGIPHIHDDGLQGLALPFAHAGKESLQGASFSVFSHPGHPSRQVVQDHRQVTVAFADGDLVDGQDMQPLVVGLAIFLFQKPLVDDFDGFPIQPQMVGHLLNCHDLAELVDVAGQSFGDPQVGIEQLQLFDGRPLALGADDLSVLALDPDPGRGEVEEGSLLLTVDSPAFAAANMTNGVESFVGHGFDPSAVGMHRDPVLYNANSREREIVCYTEIGHRRPPLDNFFVSIQAYYPLEIPDVHSSFPA